MIWQCCYNSATNPRRQQWEDGLCPLEFPTTSENADGNDYGYDYGDDASVGADCVVVPVARMIVHVTLTLPGKGSLGWTKGRYRTPKPQSLCPGCAWESK